MKDLKEKGVSKIDGIQPAPSSLVQRNPHLEHYYVGNSSMECPGCHKVTLSYSRATNGHISARCSATCVSFME